MKKHITLVAAALVSGLAQAQQIPDKAVDIIELAPGLHMVMGVGGNIAASTGPDGVFIVDDDMPPLSDKIEAALRTLRDEPVRMVFNTHWHFDHTGGNKHFAGKGALVVAHDNVRERMSSEQFSRFFNRTTPASPPEALPVVTFDESITFHLNGMTIRAQHMNPAHTDGDAVLFFEEANVVHTGDVFTNRQYPFIDIDGGGSARGMIAAVEALLPLLNEDTVIIPGHGPKASVEDLQTYLTMLKTIVNRIQLLVDEGKTIEEVIALQPTVNYDAVWAWNFLPSEKFTTLVYQSLQASAEPQE